MTTIGRMRHLVTIERMVESRDDTGAVILTPTTMATMFTALEPLQGREFFAAGAVQAEIDHRALLRTVEAPDVTVKDRLLDTDGHVYDIRSVRQVDGRPAMTELMLRQVVA